MDQHSWFFSLMALYAAILISKSPHLTNKIFLTCLSSIFLLAGFFSKPIPAGFFFSLCLLTMLVGLPKTTWKYLLSCFFICSIFVLLLVMITFWHLGFKPRRFVADLVLNPLIFGKERLDFLKSYYSFNKLSSALFYPKPFEPLSLKLYSYFLIYLAFAFFSVKIFFLIFKSKTSPFPLIRNHRDLFLMALLPQFVMFGNFVSNDSLANFFGALIIYQSALFLRRPRFRHLLLLATWLGLGLLTKATFLAFIPVLLIFVILIQVKEKKKFLFLFGQTLIFILVFSILGSYKFVQNYTHFGRPFIHNTDPLVQEATGWPWAKDQKGTYRGLSSWLDWNIGKLIMQPTFSESTRHSFFLLLYGTLWYQYIHESNLEGNLTRFRYFGSFLYILAVVPTVLMMLGAIKFFNEAFFSLKRKDWNERFLYQALSISLFLSTLAMIVAVGLKTDVWSCFQARIFFPAIWGMAVLFASGLESIENKPQLFRIITLLLTILYINFVFYFLIELALLLF